MKPWADLTDSQRMWVLMNRSGTEGIHSHTLRGQGVSGNPSQRAKDIVSKGQEVYTAREPVGKRPGSRYWLEAFAPDFATRVLPNGHAVGVGNPETSEICSAGVDRVVVWDYMDQAA